jgi:hypothetical protein
MNHLSGKIALFFLSAALLLAACGPASRQRTVAVMDDVETYINERPDSALAALTAVDTTSLTTRALRARYFLLKSVALDKNYIDDGSFLAEMETATEWYALHGTMEERARAWFYLADQQKDAGESAEAAVNFSRALDLAEKGEDWFLAGMCARNMSDIYRSGFDYRRSLEYARKSVVYFSQAEAPAHVLYARLMLAEDYYNNGYSDICLNLCDSLQVEAASAGNSGVLADSYFTAAMVYIHKTPPQFDSTLILLDKTAKLFPLSVQQQALYAWSLYLKGDKLTAREMIISAQNAARTSKDSLYVLPWAARIAREAGDMEQYVALQEDIIEKTDAFTRNTILRSVDRAQAQYYRQQEMFLSQRIQRNRLYGFVFSLLFVLLIIFLLCVAQMRKTKLEAEKSRILEMYSNLEKEAAEQETHSAHLQNQLNRFSETARQERLLRFRQAGKLQSSIWRLDHLGLPAWFKENQDMEAIKKELSYVYDIDDSGEKLVRRLDRELDGAITSLAEKLNLQDKPQEQFFLCCCLLDLPSDVVAAKFELSAVNVRVKKHRLREQIAKLNDADFDALFDIRR